MMLRVVISLDCDRCRQSYYQGVVSSEADSDFWESEAEELKICASMEGWYTDGEEIVCDDCVEKAEAQYESQQAVLVG